MRSFIDTNVLVYAESDEDPRKKSIAIELIAALRRTDHAVLSVQVLQEFCHVALRKLAMSPEQIQARLQFYSQFQLVQPSATLVSQGVDLHVTHQVAFYDSLIVAAAQAAGCRTLYSEDFQSGRVFRGLSIINPFAIAPDLSVHEPVPVQVNPARRTKK
jgi:predicted nucleic acid-binding protein